MMTILIVQMRSSERYRYLPTVTQQVRGRLKIQVQDCLTPESWLIARLSHSLRLTESESLGKRSRCLYFLKLHATPGHSNAQPRLGTPELPQLPHCADGEIKTAPQGAALAQGHTAGQRV